MTWPRVRRNSDCNSDVIISAYYYSSAGHDTNNVLIDVWWHRSSAGATRNAFIKRPVQTTQHYCPSVACRSLLSNYIRLHLHLTFALAVEVWCTSSGLWRGQFHSGELKKGTITSKIKHAIKLKTSPARLAQLFYCMFYFTCDRSLSPYHKYDKS